jgi:outer membrane protein, heavy metal efflux system
MTRSHVLILFCSCSSLPLLLGCQAYLPRPLDPAAVIDQLDRTRHQPDPGAPDPGAPDIGATSQAFTLERAATWMAEYGPELREAVAEYRTAVARARIKTPLPNPVLEVGAEYGFGSDVSKARVVPFGSIGFAIPTGGRLDSEDQLNQAQAEVARVTAISRHRETYLRLRQLYTSLATARRREVARREIASAAERSVQVSRQLVEAGQATASDVALFELEHARSEVDVLNSQARTAAVESALATLIGVHAEHFVRLPEEPLPKLPGELPPLASLKRMLVVHHAGLARLRAGYAASERALRLEIARQYPDLGFGVSGGGDVGDHKTVIGLPLGIELPLFDRNEQGIAQAEGRREEFRTKYVAAAGRALANLEHAHRVAELAARTRRILRQTILPKAHNSIELARRALAAGSGDLLRLLDSERTFRQVQIETLEAQLAEYLAWSSLEQAVGFPLLKFPHEPLEKEGGAPEELRQSTQAEGSR